MERRWWISGRWYLASAFLLTLAGCLDKPKTAPTPPTSPTAQTPVPDAKKRNPIYFLQGDATLSPGALEKLDAWTEAWGTKGSWVLECPSGPGIPYTLMERRILALRAELQKRGVASVETRLLPREPASLYDAIYVLKEMP